MANGGHTEERVDVALKWQDFVHYVAEAKFLNGDFSEERDWYRLNAFDIVQLGCKSIAENGSISQKMGTIVVGIENITPYLHRAPRLFRRILDVLISALNSDKSSFSMWKRCWNIVISIKSAVIQDLRLYMHFAAILIEQRKNIESRSQNQPSLIRSQVKDVYNELKERHISGNNLLRIVGFEYQEDNSFVSLQVYFITERYGSANFVLIWNELGVGEFIKKLSEHFSSEEVLIIEILKLVEIFVKIISKEEHFTKEIMTNNGAPGKESTESLLEGLKDIFSACIGLVSSCRDLLDIETSSAAKILAYISSIFYSTYSDTCTLKEVWGNACIEETVKSLARFASDVAANDDKMIASVFENSIEFMTTTAEFDVPQYKASLVMLPNILSPALEYRDARLISKALEFGALALHSKHQKSVLGEGLWHIRKCLQLFKPLEEIMNHIKKCESRIEAVLTSVSILDGVVESMALHSSAGTEEEAVDRETRDSSETLKYLQSYEEQAQNGTRMPGDLRNFPEDLRNVHDIVQQSYKLEDTIDASDSVHLKDIHTLLFELACSMIKAGNDIIHTFAGIIPSLFSPSYLPDLPDIPSLSQHCFQEFQTRKTTIPWKVDKKELALKTLELCLKCVNHGSSSPFQICSVMIPKVANNISKNRLSDSEKVDALKEFIDLCISKAHERNAVNGLLTHGLNLISMLMPTDMDVSDMRAFLPLMLKSLKKILDSTSLLYLASSCGFLMANFPDQNEKLKDLFCKLLQKGKRNDIRNVHHLSSPWLKEPRFHFILDALFSFAAGHLKSKQIEHLSETVSSVVDIEKRLIAKIKEHDSFEEPVASFVKQLTTPIISDVSLSLSRNEFDQTKQDSVVERVSSLMLYKAFFEEELVQRVMSGNIEDCNVDSRIPDDVKQDVQKMTLLKGIARRIEHMQVPRYQSLKKVLLEVIKVFMKTDQKESENSDSVSEKPIAESQLARRSNAVEDYLSSLPQNVSLYTRLLSCGYKENLWRDEIELIVATDGSLNTEENLRQTLLVSFTEYVELLKQLGISTVKIEGKDVEISDIFSDDLTMNDLKGRRAVVVKSIDKELSKNPKPRIQDRKLQLLTDEERIENEMEAKSNAKLKPRKFTAKININFFDCATCCGSHIIGCYAPNGDHCERPLEIGMRYDSALASIYDESGLEIENAELLFMDQGVLVFRAYSNGHPYDTSQVWIDLFEELVERRDVIPAIILPYNMPNRHTWESTRRISSTLLTGVMLTCDFDFSSEWKTYYDMKPESARCGKDIILSKGFKSSRVRPGFLRQFSVNVGKDLGGMIFDEFMQAMMKDVALGRFRFLGSSVAEYISEFVESGQENREIISNVFNYDRWKDKDIKSENELFLTKEEIINSLCSLFRNVYIDFMSKVDLKDMFRTKRRQFFQLKRLLEKLNAVSEGTFSSSYIEKMNAILKSSIKIFLIDDLPITVQEEAMHWIFGNEDRVWRNRGGRDGYETIEQYLNFLAHVRNSKHKASQFPAFPGVLAIAENMNQGSNENIQVKNIAGYAVGEYVGDLSDEDTDGEEELTENPDFYEIVTAWVHHDYRKVNLSTQLYGEVFKSVTSPFVAFDVLQGSVERIIKGSNMLRTVTKLLPMSMLVHSQEKSYNVLTVEEQFERLIVKRRPVKYAILTYEYANRLCKNKYLLLILTVIFFSNWLYYCMC